MHRSILSAMLATTTLIATPALAANLVGNGSFEQGIFTGGSFGFPLAQQINPGDSTTLPGWTTSSAELAWFRSGQAGITTIAGDKALDLTGFTDTQGVYAAVTQSIATQVGAVYRLTFLGGTYSLNGTDPSAGIRASAGGTSQNFTFTPTGSTSGTWTSYTFDFTATSTSTAISFLGFNAANTDPTYTGLDDVAVELIRPAQGAVPEPATWGMMILGFGAIGASMRRRPTVRVSFI